MDPERWAAVVGRDKTFDGAFVYCVKSTKIYCRPTCAARLARRANVHFCDTAHEAEVAGFRPCKRCKPELMFYTPQDDKIQQACSTICRASLGPDNPRLEDLAKEAGLTKHHFHRLFKKKTGLTPRQYAEVLRAGDAALPATTTPALTTSDASSASRSPMDSLSPLCSLTSPTPDPTFGIINNDMLDPSLLGSDLLDKSPEAFPVDINTWEWFDLEVAGDPLADPIEG